MPYAIKVDGEWATEPDSLGIPRVVTYPSQAKAKAEARALWRDAPQWKGKKTSPPNLKVVRVSTQKVESLNAEYRRGRDVSRLEESRQKLERVAARMADRKVSRQFQGGS